MLTLLASCSSNVPQKKEPALVSQEKSQLKVIIPKAWSNPEYFKRIDARVKEANLPNLRSTLLPKDDLEFRVWIAFAKQQSPQGFIVRRTAGRWAATYLESINLTTHTPYRIELASPKSGWEDLWNRLVAEGILALPDSSELNGQQLAVDGVDYIVEMNMNQTYRVYSYVNPKYQEWREAKQIIKIVASLLDEFDIKDNRRLLDEA